LEAGVYQTLLVCPKEWDREANDGSVLIRGRYLQEAEQWLAQSAENEPKATALQTQYVSCPSCDMGCLWKQKNNCPQMLVLLSASRTTWSIYVPFSEQEHYVLDISPQMHTIRRQSASLPK